MSMSLAGESEDSRLTANEATKREYIVRYENVTKMYADKTAAVQNLNLDVARGEFVVLIGPSGCGKTTTLKMANRLIEPTHGHIYIEGNNIQDLNVVELRRQIGYVIQQVGLFPHMTVGQNIALVPALQRWPKERQKQRVRQLLEMVQMDPALFENRYPRELSGGQQQRVGVLRALAADPDLILMDEPFGALDPITREKLQDELKRLQQRVHKTILFVTHDMDEALKLADRIVIMDRGQVVQIGTPEEILRHPAGEFVRQFIGSQRMLRGPDDVQVGEVMIPDPVTVQGNVGLNQALNQMRRHRVDSLLVVDDERRLLGLLTIETLQRSLLENKSGRVDECMRMELATVHPEETVRVAVQRMAASGRRHLPVVDAEGRLVGLLTRASLVGVLADVLWNVGTDAAAGKTVGEEATA